MSKEYKDVAKKLGVYYLFGRWGIKLLPQDPNGWSGKLFSIVGLDGWTFDSHEIIQAMFDDPDFEVEIKRDKKI